MIASRQRIGRYHVLELLGRGGMGEVYSAYDPDLQRRVALKIVYTPQAAASDPDAMAQRQMLLLREAQSLARIAHINVVPVFDVGVARDQSVFLAMELIEGETLASYTQSHACSARQIIEFYVGAGSGLGAAHAQDLVHRDFKPDNCLVGTDGIVRVLDFGLVEEMQSGSSVVDPVVGGTLPYMAPEQSLGCKCTVQSDIFSFCTALFESLEGTRPFPSQPPGDRAIAIAHADIEWGTKTPRWLQPILARGLRHAPEDRFDDMAELVAALRDGMAGWRDDNPRTQLSLISPKSHAMRAEILRQLGEFSHAQSSATLALWLHQHQFGARSHLSYDLLNTLAAILLDRDRPHSALEQLARARGRFDPAEVAEQQLAYHQFLTAQATWAMDASAVGRRRALDWLARARRNYALQGPGGTVGLAALSAWTKSHI